MVSFTLRALAALAGLATAIPTNRRWDNDDSWKSKIKNVIVLVEENRSFDTFCGGLTYNRNNPPHRLLNVWLATDGLTASIDGLLHRNFCNSL
jgi:phospholipase C